MINMLTLEEYKTLWATKDLKLMERSGMDKEQRESVNNECKWTAAVLERIGDAIQTEGLVIPEDQQYRLSIIMRSANNDCRKCKCPEK
jgi:hypothetical protein